MMDKFVMNVQRKAGVVTTRGVRTDVTGIWRIVTAWRLPLRVFALRKVAIEFGWHREPGRAMRTGA